MNSAAMNFIPVANLKQYRRHCAVDEGSDWFVVQVIGGKEIVTVVLLDSENITAWVPTRKVQRKFKAKRSGGKSTLITIHEARSPGYIFVKARREIETVHGICSFRPVTGILSDQRGLPTLVPEKTMTKMQGLNDDEFDFIASQYSYEPGQPVRINEGPFNNYQGKVSMDYTKGSPIVSVEIEGMAGVVSVPIPAENLEKV